MPAVRGKTPTSRLFVFDAPAIMPKRWVAFLARDLLLAIVIEAAHGRPGSSSTGLPRLGTSPTGKSKLVRQRGRLDAHRLEVFPFWQAIHPGTEACIADELHRANALVNGR